VSRQVCLRGFYFSAPSCGHHFTDLPCQLLLAFDAAGGRVEVSGPQHRPLMQIERDAKSHAESLITTNLRLLERKLRRCRDAALIGLSVCNLTASRGQLLGPLLEDPPFVRHPKVYHVRPSVDSSRRHMQ
jgi:hypothetical protein